MKNIFRINFIGNFRTNTVRKIMYLTVYDQLLVSFNNTNYALAIKADLRHKLTNLKNFL